MGNAEFFPILGFYWKQMFIKFGNWGFFLCKWLYSQQIPKLGKIEHSQFHLTQVHCKTDIRKLTSTKKIPTFNSEIGKLISTKKIPIWLIKSLGKGCFLAKADVTFHRKTYTNAYRLNGSKRLLTTLRPLKRFRKCTLGCRSHQKLRGKTWIKCSNCGRISA